MKLTLFHLLDEPQFRLFRICPDIQRAQSVAQWNLKRPCAGVHATLMDLWYQGGAEQVNELNIQAGCAMPHDHTEDKSIANGAKAT